ncbi:MAG TPA: N-acetylmuramoyl-L-alanine amidase [Candidatus Dormibacteraeota bacterium]|nr:N-acetylmuramoyl-L-alanine amidase [Candidatus Dormibacteraeota bacterium]
MWLVNIADSNPIKNNYQRGGMRSLHGLVLHVEDGTERGTFEQFNATDAQLAKHGDNPASAHFGNPREGRLEQFVDTFDVAWAECAGNRDWISVENEGRVGEKLTDSQIWNLALLFAWLHWNEGVPFNLAEKPSDFGLGYHSMGGKAWGHPYCPGGPIIRQRTAILKLAQTLPQQRFGFPGVDDLKSSVA